MDLKPAYLWCRRRCGIHTVRNDGSRYQGNELSLTDITTSMKGKSVSANPLVILTASFKNFLHLLRYTLGRFRSSVRIAEFP